MILRNQVKEKLHFVSSRYLQNVKKSYFWQYNLIQNHQKTKSGSYRVFPMPRGKICGLIRICFLKKISSKRQNSSLDNVCTLMEMGFKPKVCLEALISMPNVEAVVNFLMKKADIPPPSTDQRGGSDLSSEETDADEQSGVEYGEKGW